MISTMLLRPSQSAQSKNAVAEGDTSLTWHNKGGFHKEAEYQQ